jgi:hypothetical protein
MIIHKPVDIKNYKEEDVLKLMNDVKNNIEKSLIPV